MIDVAITTYPQSEAECTVWRRMPFPPSKGDTIHFGDDNIAPVVITHVSWAYEPRPGKWHVECSAR